MVMNGKVGTVSILGTFGVNSHSHQINPNGDWLLGILRNFSYSERFNGLIDEVRIWNIARTQEQIQATMNISLTGNEPGLVGYWSFDEEPGTPTAFDSSPNSNDGTLFGDADFVESDAPVALPTVEPNIKVIPTALDFGDVSVGTFADRTLTVINTGEQNLHVTDISIDSNDVTVIPNSFSLALGQSQQVFLRYSPEIEAPLDATLTIESNDPDDGIVEVAVTGQGVPHQNRALSLDGNGDYVRIGNNPIFAPDNLTIEAWFNPTDIRGCHIISRYEETEKSYEIYLPGDGSVRYAIVNTSGDGFGFDTGSIDINKWQHVAMTFDGSQIEGYLNGIQCRVS